MILILSKARHPKCVNHHHHHSSRSNDIPSSNTSGGCCSSSPTDPDLFDLSSMNNTLRSCYYFKPIDPPTCGTSSIISTATTSTSIETTAGAATFSPTSSSSLRIENRQDNKEEEKEEQTPALQQQSFALISPTAPCSTPLARQTNKRVLPSNQDEKVDDGFYHPHCYHPCTPPRGPLPPSRTHHYSSTPLSDRCRRQHRRQDAYCWSPPPPPNPTRKRRRMIIGTTTGTSAIYSTSTTTSKENLLFPFILNDEDEDKESNLSLFKDRENPSSCSWIVNMKNTETTRTARKKITIDRKWKLMPRKRTFVEEPIPFSSSCNTLPAINAASKILD